MVTNAPLEQLRDLADVPEGGTITVIAGDTGVSKSLLIQQLLSDKVRENVGADALMLEDDAEHYNRRALAQLTGNANLTNVSWMVENADQVLAAVREHEWQLPRMIAATHCAEGGITYDDILAWMRGRLAAGSRVLYVDPITAVEVGDAKVWIADREFLESARTILDEHRAHLIVVTHARGGAKGESMEDVAMSPEWTRLADTVLWLSRSDDAGGNRVLTRLKSPDKGLEGSRISLHFDPKTLTFRQPDVVPARSKHTFCFDVESVGLYGEGYAVGYVVVDGDGREIEAGRYACRPDDAIGRRVDREWVSANCPPIAPTHAGASGVRDAFAGDLKRWIDAGAIIVSDCGWPVEAMFLSACIDEGAMESGPHPLHDVATALLAAGMDPLAPYPRRDEELPKHDPLADARQSARLWLEAMKLLAMRRERAACYESPWD